MIVRVLAFTLALVIAVGLGWVLAYTKPVHMPLNSSDVLALPQGPIISGQEDSEQGLKILYERSAWSARKLDSDTADDSHAAAVPAPEGLQRFRLLGVLKVSGAAPEALLQDLNLGDGESAVFSALENDNLRESGVTLTKIDNQKIYLKQGEETQTLFLFPRSLTYGRDE